MHDDLTPEQWRQIEDHLYAGRKIHAVKLVHEHTGAKLTDIKQMLDHHERELREQFPDRFTAAPAAAGCGTTVVALAVIAGAGVVLAVT